ncbi:AGAP005561-PA, related [Eimeria maxima]|uniref:AGAP005561-PA, related n=1 Tax=Eimeria maxima TaxID=5804 RepID=U6M8R4_EIMMA|nr:AGAP005561-PA, related [Eimeria maxima]CDJ58030.1 AGAP005561-PA, related [Eimeria maxima]
MATGDREYLSLKVMRLSQPSWESNPWPLISLRDLARDDLDASLARAEETVNEKWLSSAHSLLLPITQGRVFSGETFSAYLNIANVSSIQANNVKLQVELFLGNSRHLLFDNSEDPVRSLNPEDSFDCTIQHQIEESGTCMFTAQSPFKTAHRITHLQDKTLVECTLTNVSQQHVFLNEASILCAEECFAYSPASVLVQHIPNLGTLTLQWRTSTGGVGTLSDYELLNAPKPMQPLEMRLVDFPSSIQVDHPFTVELEVINRLQTDLELILCVKLSELEPFVLEGPKQLNLGPLGPRSSKRFSFEMLCLQPGALLNVVPLLLMTPSTSCW